MKKILIASFLFQILLVADEIDTYVEKIKQQRVSHIDKNEIKKLKSPLPKIVVVDKNISKADQNISAETETIPTFVLKAIMNDSAFINDRWVKKGDTIDNYKVVDIMEDAVYLSNGKKSKMIFFKKKNGKIILRKVSK